MNYLFRCFLFILTLMFIQGCTKKDEESTYLILSKDDLKDKIMGAWALQTIGVTYGGPTEFRYLKRIIPDSIDITWSDSSMYDAMTNRAGLYDDIYMDLTFVEVLEKEGFDAGAMSFATAYANADYWLWHANQHGNLDMYLLSNSYFLQ